MAISSVNIQKTKANSIDETKRIFEAKYLLPKEVRKENEYWDCGKSDAEVFKEEFSKAKPKGGRKPKLENSLWEAVINLNENHKMQDVQKVTKHIENKFNIICTRIAIHRDEGKVLDDGTVKYNYHAHLNFCTYKDGRQNWRRQLIKRKDLSELQTEVAEILKMERGKQGSTAVRANHRELRQNYDAIMEQRQALAKVKDVKAQFKQEKQTLINSQKATQTDYTNLRKKYKELEELARKKDLTIKALEKEVYSEKWKNKEKKPAKNKDVVVYLEKKLAEKPKEIYVENPLNRALQKELSEKKEELKEKEIEISEKEEFLSGAVEAQDKFRSYAQTYQKQLIEAQETIETQKTENSTLKAENSEIRRNMDEIESILNDDIQEYKENSYKKFNLFSFLKEKIISLKAEVSRLFKENMDLKTDNEILKKENQELMKEDTELEKAWDEMQKDPKMKISEKSEEEEI